MSKPFTIVSWNIFQGLHHTANRRAWTPNLRIEDDLEALDADVLVLPEAWRFGQPKAMWAEELAERLDYDLHQWVADRPSRKRETVPWRMVMLTRIPTRPLPPQIMPQFGNFGQRAIVRAELVDSGLTIAAAHLYGIHLVRSTTPRAWIRERRELEVTAANNDIVVGDLNMWGPVVRRDTTPLRSAVRGRTFPAKRPHSQIDHLLVSSQVEVLRSQVLPEMGSDHRAIRANLQALTSGV